LFAQAIYLAAIRAWRNPINLPCDRSSPRWPRFGKEHRSFGETMPLDFYTNLFFSLISNQGSGRYTICLSLLRELVVVKGVACIRARIRYGDFPFCESVFS